MSLDATRFAWSQQGLRPIQKLIFLSLADRAGADDVAWPSHAQLVFDTGADRKTIIASLTELEARGLITKAGTKGKTKRVVAWKILRVPHRENEEKRNDSENGTIPKTPGNSPKNGTLNSPKNGTRNLPLESTNNQPLPAARASCVFAMTLDWKPGERFADMLALAGLKNYPWEDELSEFILYRLGHSDRMSQGSWEHKFIQTLKRNAVRRTQQGNEPTQIPVDWQPPRDVVAALIANGISRRFLDDASLEFVSFWRDAGNYAQSWTAKFIQHVSAQWARYVPPAPSTFDNLTDRSWAAGIVDGIEKSQSTTWNQETLINREWTHT